MKAIGLTLKNWKRIFAANLVLGGALGTLSFFHPVNQPIYLYGQVAPAVVLTALPVSLIYWFLRAGFPEELLQGLPAGASFVPSKVPDECPRND